MNDDRFAALLDGLNQPQLEAVTHIGAPLLVVAGAGSGKTRVLTRRIAFLVGARGVEPSAIMAITFTNKAAAEMRERVVELVGNRAKWMWVSTFHSACVRILRADGDHIGLRRSFTIYDDADSRKVMQLVLKDNGVDVKKFTPRAALGWVSKQKNGLVGPEEAAATARSFGPEKIFAEAYQGYQARLRMANALDFDDLLYYTEQLLRTCPGVRETYRRRFRHVLVDEYQDTNYAQYMMIHWLCAANTRDDPALVEAPELMVVGDSDQSIYAFRGANIRNITDFEDDFPGAKTIVLEQNYRSTQTVLSAANAVIERNPDRRKKNLWTEANTGDQIVGWVADTDKAEADWVVEQVAQLVGEGKTRYGEIAVFYRTNAQSRNFEEALLGSGVPYRLVGSVRFYERREVRDALGYLRAIVNPDDDVSLRRVLNVPKRGIGDTTEANIADFARRNSMSFGAACERITDVGLPGRATRLVAEFADVMRDLRALNASGASADEVLRAVLERSGMVADLHESTDPQDATRLENLEELVNVAAKFVAEMTAISLEDDDDDAGHEGGVASRVGAAEPTGGLSQRQGGSAADAQTQTQARVQAEPDAEAAAGGLAGGAPEPDPSLAAFLERIALAADTDALPDASEGVVTLMTLHAAKGLEFDDVFITGLEEGIFPHARSLDDPEELPEERRLAYVGLTRAKKRLFLSRASIRAAWGTSQTNPESRFIKEIPAELIDWKRLGYESRHAGDEHTRWTARVGRDRDPEPSGHVFGTGRSVPRASATGAEFNVGDSVLHATFGLGKVLATNGVGKDATVDVDFGSAGKKRLALAFAPLERL
ncbi:MAG: UvrD-helicase domain-containing protein [Propionibacteriaceae bacterium]|jgi:DNA helicase-2/ATP-dependent DNA helicase PcrA|nr:UvrD-helicase domain-containing protein [Propionibacteriaceae bacterium]